MTDFQTENNQESIQIMVAEDQLSASVWIQQGESHYTAALLKNRLSEAGVTSGLQEETIQQQANGKQKEQKLIKHQTFSGKKQFFFIRWKMDVLNGIVIFCQFVAAAQFFR